MVLMIGEKKTERCFVLCSTKNSVPAIVCRRAISGQSRSYTSENNCRCYCTV